MPLLITAARCVLTAVASLCCALAAAQDRDSVESKPIPELIRLLGSKHFRERDNAEHALSGRPDATPHLRIASKSADAEVARRAMAILKAMEHAQLQRYLAYGRS